MSRTGSNKRAASASLPISASPVRDEPMPSPVIRSCHPSGEIQARGSETTPLVVEAPFQSARRACATARLVAVSGALCSDCLISAGLARDEPVPSPVILFMPSRRPPFRCEVVKTTPYVVEVPFQSFQSAHRACATARLVGVSCSFCSNCLFSPKSRAGRGPTSSPVSSATSNSPGGSAHDVGLDRTGPAVRRTRTA